MKRLIFLTFISFLSLSFAGCEKNLGPGSIGITVVNSDGQPIQNCQVSLTVPVDNAVTYYGITDINGYIEFGSGLHVYYDVTAWKGLWLGCDFVEIKPGENNTKKVVIYPQGTTTNGCL